MLVLTLITPSLARAASINATLDRETLALGDTAVLKVSIEGGTGRDTPRVPEVPGLRFTLTGNGMSFSFENGRQSILSEISYAVTANKIGEYTIGPITAVIAGDPIQTGPLRLKVVAANDPAAARNDGLDQAAFLRLVLPDRDLYVGESFAVEIQLYAIGGRLQQAPQLAADGFTIGKLQDAGQQGNIRVNNRIYTRARFLQTVTAARTGALSLQAISCILDIPLPRRGGLSDPFDDVFGLRENRRFNLSTEPSTVRVLPLPKEGRPPGFNGAVGDFELALSATPTNLHAGDPITVRIDVQGRGNFDSVQLPEQSAWRGFRSYPPTASFETKDPSGISGVKHFEQVVSPESADLTALPAFTFSFFHPESKTYKTVRSAPVPLRVSPGAASPSLPSHTSAADSPSSAPQPDLAPLKPHLGAVVAPPVDWVNQPWFIGMTLVPPLALVFLRLWQLRRSRQSADREATRRADLEKRIAKGLASLADLGQRRDSEAFFATLFRTLQEAVALRTGRAPASITEGSLDSDLSRLGVTAETIGALHRLFQACNQARYAKVANAADFEALLGMATTVCAALKSRP